MVFHVALKFPKEEGDVGGRGPVLEGANIGPVANRVSTVVESNQ